MNIPGFLEGRVVDKDGFFTPVWREIMRQVLTQLQINFSDEGYLLPQQPTANVVQLNTTKSLGAILYNTDTDKGMINIAGTFKEIVTT